MARRKITPDPNANHPKLNVTISLRQDGAIEIDPQFNRLMIEHLDQLYEAANDISGVDEYEDTWTDDHKIAFFIADLIDGVLAQWGAPEEPDMADGVAQVPHINETPVRDVFDLGKMGIAKAKKTN